MPEDYDTSSSTASLWQTLLFWKPSSCLISVRTNSSLAATENRASGRSSKSEEVESSSLGIRLWALPLNLTPGHGSAAVTEPPALHTPARPHAAQWRHRLKWGPAHSRLLSGSEHIHKDTHVRRRLSILPTAAAVSVASSVPVLWTGHGHSVSAASCILCSSEKYPMP